MVAVTLPVSDTLALIDRPVIYSVLREVQNKTQISSKTLVRFFGEDAKGQQLGSSMESTTEHNIWPVVEALTIEVEEEYNSDRILNMQVYGAENPFVFLDSDLGFYIKPAYSTQDITIRFKYKAKDRNQAVKWRNDIRTRMAQLRSTLMHELTYSYHMPEQYIDLVREIYTLREAIGGYGESFDQYLFNHSTSRLTTLSNQNGSKYIYAIAENQAGIVGSFDFDTAPDKPEKEGELDNWTVSFSYKFRYEKPISVVCKYPFLVHQQFVAPKYMPLPSYDLVAVYKRLSNSGRSLAYFQTDNINDRMMADKGVNIPTYDEFIPAYIAPFTLKALTVLLTISESDKRSLLNLKELGDFTFRQEILDFMVNEAPYMTKVTGSIFCCQLYENENVVEEGILSIDSNLNVVATADLDIRKQYRVRLSLVADMAMLGDAARARLKASGTVLNLLVSAMNAALGNSGNQQGMYKNQLSLGDYQMLGLKGPTASGVGNSLVQILYIVAARSDQYTAAVPDAPVANTNPIPQIPAYGSN